MWTTVYGKELKVGDTIEVWWGNHRDTITKLEPYNGPLAHLFDEGAQLAEFALLKTGMTIDNGDYYKILKIEGKTFRSRKAALEYARSQTADTRRKHKAVADTAWRFNRKTGEYERVSRWTVVLEK